jgi:hypothetical protein
MMWNADEVVSLLDPEGICALLHARALTTPHIYIYMRALLRTPHIYIYTHARALTHLIYIYIYTCARSYAHLIYIYVRTSHTPTLLTHGTYKISLSCVYVHVWSYHFFEAHV